MPPPLQVFEPHLKLPGNCSSHPAAWRCANRTRWVLLKRCWKPICVSLNGTLTTAKPVLFDRGFPDVVGFLDVSGLTVPKAVDQACRNLRYSGPILRAPAWAAIYVQDKERIQDWDQAVASDEAVTEAWRRYGYEVAD
jgi:predicted ATPase